MKHYQHIVFDVDGTILDTEYSILKSLERLVLRETGRETGPEELAFCLGITGEAALNRLGIPATREIFDIWNAYAAEEAGTIRVFDGIIPAWEALKSVGKTLGVITSRSRSEYEKEVVSRGLDRYMDVSVCCDDTKRHKPEPGPMLCYLERAGAKPEEVLYVGDSVYDMECAAAAGVDGALALWGCRSKQHIRAAYYLDTPWDILKFAGDRRQAAKKAEDGGKGSGPVPLSGPRKAEPWLAWAVELQAIAQAGLAYTKDGYDRERFTRIREIAAEMVSRQSGAPVGTVKELFCCETGYQTPKLDTRAVIVRGGKILLVQEKNGTWAMPGGWVDVNQSVRDNTEKEALEEAGLRVRARRILAVHDRNRHNQPPYAYGVCKFFVECQVLGGKFAPNLETVDSRYFGLDELPPLALEKNTGEQIALCLEAAGRPDWQTVFD